jgi:MraZ protein
MERYLFGGAVEAELDRQGRVAVPAPLMQHADLNREIVVVGVRDRLEIWDRVAWERGLAELEGSAENVAERLVRDAR